MSRAPRSYAPPPWVIETGGAGHRIVAYVGPEKLKVTIATAHGMRSDEARLMAAAPEMLAQLRANHTTLKNLLARFERTGADVSLATLQIQIAATEKTIARALVG